MAIVRDLIALVLAAGVAFLTFLIVSGGLSTVAELGVYVRTALWYVGPAIVVASIVLAPILFFLRRRGLLTFWTVLGLYAAFPIALSVELVIVYPSPDILRGVTVYLLSGVAAGLAYWAVEVLPSNPTMERDVRKTSARPSL
jgi:hypothetical protein